MQISIVIATFNAGKTLKHCLDSIIPQLTDDCELILVDGDSKDNTNEIIDSYGDKIAVHISEPDRGIYDAWNKGVRLAHGEWVGFVGADDMLLEGALDKYLQVIKSTDNIDTYDYICAHNEYVDKRGKLLKTVGEMPVWKKMRKRMVAAHVASLQNKHNLFETIGGYDLQFHICADYDLLLRKRDKLKSLYIDFSMARMETGGMSFSIKAIKETYLIRKKNHSVSLLQNKLLFIRDLLAFKFFIIRKSLGGGILSNVISKIKGEKYEIDDRFPKSYIFRLLLSKSVSLLYGMVRLRTLKKAFIYPSTTIMCSEMIHLKGTINIGRKCFINPVSERGLVCGRNVSMGYGTYIELTGSLHLLGKGMIVGDNVGLGSHGFYGSGSGLLEIGDDTIIGNYVSIHPENHNYKDMRVPIRLQGVNGKGVRIGKNCWIGAKATILDGTVIGNGCIVAAGAVVKGQFPDNVIIGGVPAKIIKER